MQFAIAGMPVPSDVAAAGPTSPWDVRMIVRAAVDMTPQQRSRLAELIQSLPEQPGIEGLSADDYPEGPGALLLRLLRNRNIRRYSALELHLVGGGPVVSASTVAMLGPGKVVMTPQYVTAFAHLLGYAPGDMVAITGVGPAIENTGVHTASAQIAALAWNARRLGSDQIAYVVRAAQETSL